MSHRINHSTISEILNKAEAEINAAEKDIVTWKISKLGPSSKPSFQSLYEKNIGLAKSQREEKKSPAEFARAECITPENWNVIEKRLKDLELSREVESSENFQKISKLERILSEIKKEKSLSPGKRSISPVRKSVKIAKEAMKAEKKHEKKGLEAKNRSRSVKNLEKTGRSESVKPKQKKLCVYIKDLEEETERWKRKALSLSKKYHGEIKSMKKQIGEMKKFMQTEAQDFREYCQSILAYNKQ